MGLKVTAHDNAYILSECQAGKHQGNTHIYSRKHTLTASSRALIRLPLAAVGRHGNTSVATERAPPLSSSHSSLHQSERRDGRSVFFMDTRTQRDFTSKHETDPRAALSSHSGPAAVGCRSETFLTCAGVSIHLSEQT